MSVISVAAAPRAAASLSVGLVAMMAAAIFINYADRGSLSVAAPMLADRLHISSVQMGLLLSAFFWSYAVAHPFAGAIAQHFDVRWVMAVGLTLWAVATALCGLAGSFAALLALRLLVGLGESVIYPANARVLSQLASDDQRGTANAVTMLGQFLGPTAGTLIGGLILARFGWQWVFFALGGASLLWLVPWLTLPLGLGRDPEQAARARPPSYAAILSRRSLWTVSLGHFCYSYTHYLLLTWLPLYLVRGLHFSLAQMGVVGGAMYAFQALGGLSIGWLSDRAIRRGASAGRVRKLSMLVGVAGVMVAMGAVGVLPQAMVLPWLFAANFFCGGASIMVFNIGQTMGGPTAGARWIGVQNTFGQFGGISAPIITGFLVQRTGAFSSAFLVAAGLSAVGLLIWTFLVPPIEPVAWPASALANPRTSRQS